MFPENITNCVSIDSQHVPCDAKIHVVIVSIVTLQHVKFLTIIALVSIGVALASWLAL